MFTFYLLSLHFVFCACILSFILIKIHVCAAHIYPPMKNGTFGAIKVLVVFFFYYLFLFKRWVLISRSGGKIQHIYCPGGKSEQKEDAQIRNSKCQMQIKHMKIRK